MEDIKLKKGLETVEPYVVRISTPSVVGTGFLFAQSQDGSLIGIATAAHVLSYAHLWEQPLRIQHHKSGKTLMLRVPDRAILLQEEMDTGAVVFKPEDIPFPKSEPELSPVGKYLAITAEIGWVGFPAVSPNDLCFFSGRISAWIQSQGAYLVDGVAINGVSGGPAFWPVTDDKVHVIGVVSAYAPSRTMGETLPGLSIIRDVRQFQSLIKTFRSMDEAKEEEAEPSPYIAQTEEKPERIDKKSNSQQTA